MSLTLYRKYRPKSFNEVTGQEHIVKTLQGVLELQKISHAYLFTGPRGTGKTTVARLLAKALNCANLSEISEGNFNDKLSIRQSLGEGGFSLAEPCNKCDSCVGINENKSLDLIEIDAASNRGIDDIRNLRESVRYAPASGKYKVYVVDECHMLTEPAFNALLKTLEEPPPHAIFILATTDAHKIPDTILSRVQRFDFKRLSSKDIFEKLSTIAKNEKINITKDALMLVASSGDGSLRDAESNFSKLLSYGTVEIDSKIAEEILGLVPFNTVSEFTSLMASQKPNEAIQYINKMYESGVDLEIFTKSLINHLRKLLMTKMSPAILASFDEFNAEQAQLISAQSQSFQPDSIVRAIGIFINAREKMKFSPIPQLPLELAVLEFSQ